jgi:DUF4097 and DUF4098 domain-containing protein YvlB
MNATKVKAIVSLILWLVVGAIAVNAFFLFTQGGSWFAFSDPDANKPIQVLTDRTTTAEVNTIIIEWSVGGVTLKVGEEGSGIRVVERSRSDLPSNKQVQFDQNGSTLTLRSRNRTHFVFFGWGMQVSYLEVTVEPKLYQRITITQASGNTDVVGIQASAFDLTSTSGSVELNTINVKTANLIQTSGETILFGANQIETLKVTMTSGRFDGRADAQHVTVNMTSGEFGLQFHSTNPASLDHDMTSGSVIYSLPQSSPFSITVDKTSGTFSSNFTMTQNGNRYDYGTGGPVYTLDMTSGSFTIRP